MLRVPSWLLRTILLILLAGLYTACLEFQENPLDKSNGGLLGNLAIVAATGTGSGTATTIRFVALGDNGKGYTSIDGSTWTNIDAAANTNIQFKKVIWTGTRWVAVGENTSSTAPIIYHSTDGSTWTAASIPSPCGGGARNLKDVVLGGTTLMAVGQTTAIAPCVQTSTDDGVTWSETPAGAGGVPYSHVAYDGTNFYAVIPAAASAAPTVYSSNGTAGFATTGANPNISGGLGGSSSGDLLGVGNNLIWIGLDSNSPSNADSSFSGTLGASWAPDTAAIFDGNPTDRPNAMAVNGTRIVAVGANCRVDYSDDGTMNWNFNGALPACSTVTFEDVAYGSSISTFIAVGNKSSMGEIWTSTDNGLSWSEQSTGLTHTVPRTIAYRP